MNSFIPFNKPFVAGKELDYIAEAVTRGNLAGDGHFTRKCSEFLESRLRIHKVLMTPSATAALEMAAMLCELGPGDEVIMPSFTFVSTANAVARVGATPVFVDIREDTLNLDERLVEQAITDSTKAIFPVHYAGVGCDMDVIMSIANHHELKVVEDAAQAVNATYDQQALGSIGQLAAFSFHETKNYISGEGGALCINCPDMVRRAEIIRDKGTNRQEFFRGQVDKYTWVDLGSAYVPSEIVSAFLYGQLEMFDPITNRRREIYRYYEQQLKPLENDGRLRLPCIPQKCHSNYHTFYILLPDSETRDELMRHLDKLGIKAVFHYVPLHLSVMGRRLGVSVGSLCVTEKTSERLLRLPMYYGLTSDDQERVVNVVTEFAIRRKLKMKDPLPGYESVDIK